VQHACPLEPAVLESVVKKFVLSRTASTDLSGAMNFPVTFVLIVCMIGLMQLVPTDAQYTGPTLACGGTSLVKSTTLISPNNIAADGLTCVYTIRSLNLRVCQLRLDFNSFSLGQPTLDPYPRCINDVFHVQNLNFDLCGENTGQHLYVPFNPTSADRTMTITFRIASRSRIPTLTNPHWSIQVQQLECPTVTAPAAAPVAKEAVRQLADPEMLPQVARTLHSTDIGLLAPNGCLQYFTGSSGTVESFNLGGGVGPYLGGLNYAICFQRRRSNHHLRLTPTTFEIASSANPTVENPGLDELCYSNIEVMGRSEDNLHIPNAVVHLPAFPTLRASRFCSRSLVNGEIDVSAPGPFMMYFNSDDQFDPFHRETGFSMHYEIF
uniref:CUB domain-containing protein n=1 Tax=Anopheles dirus TaxID=7168 RepID=A0A182NBS7_9DIPT